MVSVQNPDQVHREETETSGRTTSIRTARSRRRNNQKAQLASHLFPSLNARGMTVAFRMSVRIGPSSLPSTTLAIATASWKSSRFLRHTETASFKLPPSKKNAAAYSAKNNIICQATKTDPKTGVTAYQTAVYSTKQTRSSVQQSSTEVV